MKYLQFLPLIFATCTVSGTVLAQTKQTVEGANQFLTQIVEDGHAKLLGSRYIPVQQLVHREKVGWFNNSIVWDKTNNVKIPDFKYFGIGSSSYLSKDSCIWRSNSGQIDLSQAVFKKEYRDGFIDYYKYKGPNHAEIELDWGKVSVVREPHYWGAGERGDFDYKDSDGNRIPGALRYNKYQGTGIMIIVKNSQYREFLQFRADDEMLDRIEYAAKFLQMSCDRTASTGF